MYVQYIIMASVYNISILPFMVYYNFKFAFVLNFMCWSSLANPNFFGTLHLVLSNVLKKHAIIIIKKNIKKKRNPTKAKQKTNKKTIQMACDWNLTVPNSLVSTYYSHLHVHVLSIQSIRCQEFCLWTLTPFIILTWMYCVFIFDKLIHPLSLFLFAVIEWITGINFFLMLNRSQHSHLGILYVLLCCWLSRQYKFHIGLNRGLQ